MKLKISKPDSCKAKKNNGKEFYPEGWCYDIEIDGKKVRKCLKGVKINMKPNEPPEATLTFAFDEIEFEGEFPNIKVRSDLEE